MYSSVFLDKTRGLSWILSGLVHGRGLPDMRVALSHLNLNIAGSTLWSEQSMLSFLSINMLKQDAASVDNSLWTIFSECSSHDYCIAVNPLA